MSLIHFVVDGKRDYGVVPALTEKILKSPIRASAQNWKELRTHRLDKKLQLAVRVAKDNNAIGVVAVFDRDKDKWKERLKTIRKGRKAEKERNASFPIAIGEAIPHLEAWLLDEPAAVREALSLSQDVDVPPVLNTPSPKNAVDALIKSSGSAGEDRSAVLGSIARHVDISRFKHPKQTGFQAFQRDVETEFQDQRG